MTWPREAAPSLRRRTAFGRFRQIEASGGRGLTRDALPDQQIWRISFSRQRKLEYGSARLARSGPQPPSMRLDDRATDD